MLEGGWGDLYVFVLVHFGSGVCLCGVWGGDGVGGSGAGGGAEV